METLPQVGFGQAVRMAFAKAFTFQGRSRRSEFWWFALLAMLIGIVCQSIDTQVLHHDPTTDFGVADVADLILFFPGIAVTARRLHDTARSGWWQLLHVIPFFGSLVILLWCAGDSKPEANAWGTSPKFAAQPFPGTYPSL